MADQKISQLPTITGANMADNDKFVLVDTSGDATVATTRAEFFKSVPNVTFGDNDKAIFGAGSDLQIYHDASASYVSEQGAGPLNLLASQLNIYNATETSQLAQFNTTSSKLFHDDAEKLATTSTGIDVTGTVTSDGLTVDGNTAINYTDTTNGFDIQGPNNRLRVTEPNANDDVRILSGRAGSGVFSIATNKSGANRDRLAIANNGDISFYEDTGTTPKFFWDSSAESLGIGTSSELAKLSVASPDSVTLKLTKLGTQAVTGNAGAKIEFNHAQSASDGANGDMTSAIIQANPISSWGGILTFATKAANGNNTTEPAERMRIDSAGRVGIGTDSPSVPLHVKAPAASIRIEDNVGSWELETDTNGSGIISINDATKVLRVFTGGSESMRITSTGQVGIGTSSPSSQVHISSSSGATLRLERDDTSISSNNIYGNILFTGNDSSGGASGTRANILVLSEGENGQAGITFKTAGSGSSAVERMRIDSSGNVGIGTDSPSADSILEVQSTTKGVRFPNMTTTQKNAMGDVAGNMVFDTTLGKMCFNTGSGWETITSS